MDGIAGIQQRVAALESKFHPEATSATSATSDSGEAFASVLNAALGSSALGGTALDGSSLGGGATTATLLSSLLGVVGRGATGGTALVGTGRAGTGGWSGVGGVGGTTGLTPAQRLSPGQYPKLQPPAELQAYGNGRIPTDRLESIGIGSHKLYAPAAQAFKQMVQAARSEGVTIGVTDSYRTYDQQVSLAQRKGLYSQGGLAATPGTSNHGWGLALDLDLDGAAQQWMRDNGWKYGFAEDTPREPWHWGYRPAAGL